MDNDRKLSILRDGTNVTQLSAVGIRTAQGAAVRRGLVEDGRLTAVRDQTLVAGFRLLPLGAPRITRDNPFLAPADAGHLDDVGIVQVGTVVSAGMVAVSVVEPAAVQRGSQRLPAGSEWVRNRSEYFDSSHDRYEVTRVEYENAKQRPIGFPRGLVERAMIDLRRLDPIEVGDGLIVDGEYLLITAIVDDEQMPTSTEGRRADLIVPDRCLSDRSNGMVRVARVLPTAKEAVAARGIGPYSLITLQPLRRSDRPAQRIRPQQISW